MQLPRPGDTKFDVLTVVIQHCSTHSNGPTVGEIRERLGLGSRSAVQFHIDDLVYLGLLDRLPKRARGLRPTTKGERLISIMSDLDGAADS